jgi:SAM-dependent methyltransferase
MTQSSISLNADTNNGAGMTQNLPAGQLELDSSSECICCRSGSYVASAKFDQPASACDALRCDSCGALADLIDGVPFFGGYEPQDFLGLIEVVATGEMNQTPIDINFARHLHSLLTDYHHASDKAEFLRNHPDDMVRAPWFSEHRYHEWMQTDAMLAGKDLSGKKVLNVGAGFGFDSVPLVDAGADVTCIDYAPTIVALGKKGLPAARWVGGFSHALPFKDESFDIVCANAAMHHMRSTPVALREMLRVLKPGGFMFTVGDPIRPDGSDDDLEFDVFNQHEGVLSGINEGIIRFGDFYDTLAEFGDQIELALIASVQDPSALQGASPAGDGAFNDYWVPCWPDNIEYLRNANGAGLCVAVKKVSSITLPAERQSHYVLPAGVLASWIGNPETAFARLMAWAPDELVNLPFPGVKQDWFSLLNGWQRPEPSNDFRRGFQRARWLLRCPGSTKLAFSIRATVGVQDIEVYINGTQECSASIDAEWRRIELDISDKAGALPFLVELRLAGSLGGLSFEQRCFDVRDRLAI